EIGELPLAMQVKLYRALQEHTIRRVGDSTERPIDVRIVAATNVELRTAVSSGKFREDLYYRLNVFPVELPPLRERPMDIVPLAQRLFDRLGPALGRPGISLSPEVAVQLTQYSWPGNIRELENVIQRALILAPGGALNSECLLLPKTGSVVPKQEKIAAGAAMDMKSLERAHILETLESVGGSRKLAAEKLGMSERTLRYKLQQYREENGEIEQ
ncbi:MAG: sigma 54-interacting transcriptional regulator, partial [Betaproteobacteria bacterium]